MRCIFHLTTLFGLVDNDFSTRKNRSTRQRIIGPLFPNEMQKRVGL